MHLTQFFDSSVSSSRATCQIIATANFGFEDSEGMSSSYNDLEARAYTHPNDIAYRLWLMVPA